MATQKFNAMQREAIWLAHAKKCAYTRELLDVSNFHIDHIVPESLGEDPAKLHAYLADLGLSLDFDLYGYGNLLPCVPGANLQKGSLLFEKSHIHYFLGIAHAKVDKINEILASIDLRKNRGRAIVLLQQCLERGELSPREVSDLLIKHAEQPEEIFALLEGMKFANAEEIRFVARAEIDALRNRTIRLGQNDHIEGVTLTNDKGEALVCRSCKEYDEAIEIGFFPYSTFDIKMAAFFEHQCGLLNALKQANVPRESYVSNPRVSVVDIDLLPYTLFPDMSDSEKERSKIETYQSKVSDGSLIVRQVRQNLLRIEEPDGMGQQLIEVARADFNGSGLEAILLFEYCYAIRGTLGYGGIRILTRRVNSGEFEVLR